MSILLHIGVVLIFPVSFQCTKKARKGLLSIKQASTGQTINGQSSISNIHISKDPKIQSLKSYIEKARQGEARRARRACLYIPRYMLGKHPNTSGVQFLTFLLYYMNPSPQPNIEIRKPNIELKFTLISVTICSLIFFICNAF